MKKVAFCSDHAGYALKQVLMEYMRSKGYELKDFGTYSEESCDYPTTLIRLRRQWNAGNVISGIGMCGSGEGISMTLNKHQEIRAALCWIPEIASLARRHNNSIS